MKKKLPLPLVIDCDGLSKKLTAELADRLSMHFKDVKIWSDEIEASKPLNGWHYEQAWLELDKFGVKVA